LRRKSFLDSTIDIAVRRKVEEIIKLVKDQGEVWETVVIQELIDELEKMKPEEVKKQNKERGKINNEHF